MGTSFDESSDDFGSIQVHLTFSVAKVVLIYVNVTFWNSCLKLWSFLSVFLLHRFRLPGSQSLKIPQHCKSSLITMLSLNPLYQRRLVFIHLCYMTIVSWFHVYKLIEWLVRSSEECLVFWMDVMFFLYWPTTAWCFVIGGWIFWVASQALLQKLCYIISAAGPKLSEFVQYV